jgi:hypothetical protein
MSINSTVMKKGEIIEKITGIEVNDTQIFRVTNEISSKLEKDSFRILPPQ